MEHKIVCLLIVAMIATFAGGCETGHTASKVAPAPLNCDSLSFGDKLRVEFTGTSRDIFQPIETEIHGDGTINLPLIGHIMAAGKSPGELEKEIPSAYAHRSSNDGVPRVTGVEVTIVPPFIYVLGQVNGGESQRIKPEGAMTVLRAIIEAGDFNPYANRHKVKITRFGGKEILFQDCVKVIDRPESDISVYPGDQIWVDRRCR